MLHGKEEGSSEQLFNAALHCDGVGVIRQRFFARIKFQFNNRAFHERGIEENAGIYRRLPTRATLIPPIVVIPCP